MTHFEKKCIGTKTIQNTWFSKALRVYLNLSIIIVVVVLGFFGCCFCNSHCYCLLLRGGCILYSSSRLRTFNLTASNNAPPNPNPTSWNWIWKTLGTLKLKVFLWKCAHNKITTWKTYTFFKLIPWISILS